MPARRSSGPYIPRGDGALRDWMNNFATIVARQPSALMLSMDDAAMLSDLALRYEAAYERANSPGSRCRPATAAKNTLRRELWDTVRPIAMRIKRIGGIHDSLKIELGIYPMPGKQSRIGRPRTPPVLTIVEATPGAHLLRYHDLADPLRMAKPHNVTELHLVILVGKRPARHPREARRIQKATRHLFNVRFDAAEARKTATYFGRWVTRRGLAGPWSMPVSMTIV